MKKDSASSIDIRNFDFFLMSYDEPGIEEKKEKLKEHIPGLKNVHGVKGEFNAWRTAAERSTTPFFVTIDADTDLNEKFSFHIHDLKENDPRVHVWRSRNPVNGLVYGHGSIHLFNKEHILSFTGFDGVDFTLGAATLGHNIQEECATTTQFNKNAYLSWRAGFKETTKLASETNLFPGTPNNYITSLSRLRIWCSVGLDSKYGDFCILGARMGAYFGLKHKDQSDKTFITKDYRFFDRMWKWLSIENQVEDLNQKYKQQLQEKFQFEVMDFSVDQSRWLKKMWYGVNYDVVERLLHKSKSPLNINY